MTGSEAIIYFMSGTGNSFRTACWIKDFALENGIKVRLIPIETANPEKELKNPDNIVAGFVMPTHAFTAPWAMIKFLLRLPKTKARAFCLATRACIKFGPVFIPGINGTGNFLAAAILALKGCDVRGIMSLDMPSNWTAFHSGLKPENATAIIERAKPQALEFAGRVFSGKKIWFTLNNFYELLCGIPLIPVSAGYLLIGRFYLAKIFFANNNCTGCSICAQKCPNSAIEMKGRDKKRPFWKYNCESCMRCMSFCPEKAIEAGHSWAVILYYITAIPVSAWIFSGFGASVPAISWLEEAGARKFLDLLYLYLSLFLSYRVFYLLTLIPAVNAFFAYTTLTRLYRRYHEPQTSLNDLAQ